MYIRIDVRDIEAAELRIFIIQINICYAQTIQGLQCPTNLFFSLVLQSVESGIFYGIMPRKHLICYTPLSCSMTFSFSFSQPFWGSYPWFFPHPYLGQLFS
uniref:Uncharacterized protein n=1 Tax=Rhizophora mucronata TaxID=61149 RepID=A0A2P2NJK4_RHIMU